MDYFEPLGLSRELVSAAAVANVGYAFAREAAANSLERNIKELGSSKDDPELRSEKRQLDELLYLAASGYLLGSSYYALLSPTIARTVFWAAAQAYDRLRMPYAAVLGICANDESIIEKHWYRFIETPHKTVSSSEAIARVLSAALMLTGNREKHFEQAHLILEEGSRFPGLLVGNASLPMRFYRDLAREAERLARPTKTNRARFPVAAFHFLERAAERVEDAQADRFHWKRLQTDILPVEPEFLASCMVVVRSLKLHDVSVTDFLEGHELHPIGRMLLERAQEMASLEWGEWSTGDRQLRERTEVLDRLWQRLH